MTDPTSGPTGQGPDSANPFSRDGASSGEQQGTTADAGAGGESGQTSGATALPPTGADPSAGSDPYGYPPSGPPSGTGSFGSYGDPPNSNHPYGDPQPYGQPSANPPYEQPPVYGQPNAAQPYGQPSANQPYEQPPVYGQQPDAYGSTGYDQTGYGVNPYQGGYGYPAYGTGAVDHPQSTAALITGIIGLVLSLACGFGGLVGIAGIVLGGKAKREIDADPARYTGRGKASAGLIMGIVGLVILVLWVVGFVVLRAAAS